MNKLLTKLLLLLLIVVAGIYALGYYFFNLNQPENLVNQLYRSQVLRQPLLRKILRLHQVGDARFDYATGQSFPELKIIIYLPVDDDLQPRTMSRFITALKPVVDKPDGFQIEEARLSINQALVDDQTLATLSRQLFTAGDTLRIFLLRTYAPAPTYAGLTDNDNSIFLFMDAIRAVADRQRSSEDAEVSTLLHEFAHLLGAQHVDSALCILSARVDNLTYGLPTNFRTTYCSADLQEIRRALAE